MTAEPLTVADDDAAVSIAAVRSFLGKHRRRSWVDLYVVGFALVIVGIYAADFLASPLSRLSHPATRAAATHAAATQAVAGAGLVVGVGVGLLLLTQALGPLALSPADASWLLLTPLARREVLRRAALSVALLATVAGALLGVLGLAMAGPYLRLTGSGTPGSWLFLSAVAGAGCCLAAVAAEALAQPGDRPRAVIRAAAQRNPPRDGEGDRRRRWWGLAANAAPSGESPPSAFGCNLPWTGRIRTARRRPSGYA